MFFKVPSQSEGFGNGTSGGSYFIVNGQTGGILRLSNRGNVCPWPDQSAPYKIGLVTYNLLGTNRLVL